MGKESGATGQVMAEDPAIELDPLEQTISIEGARVLRHEAHGLAPAPIPRAWILEGDPVAREKRLALSTDRLASAFMWDCTAGRFNWFYHEDEVVHVLEGSAIIKDAAGVRQPLHPQDRLPARAALARRAAHQGRARVSEGPVPAPAIKAAGELTS